VEIMNRILAAVIAIGFLVGCAGPNPPPDSRSLLVSDAALALLQSDESVTLGDERIRCEHRQGLGTRFQQTVCMTIEEFDRDREWSLRDAYGAGHQRVD